MIRDQLQCEQYSVAGEKELAAFAAVARRNQEFAGAAPALKGADGVSAQGANLGGGQTAGQIAEVVTHHVPSPTGWGRAERAI